MSGKAWKAAERAVAAKLGGRRVPVSGRGRGDAPDVEHPRLAVECKHRKSLPAWLLGAMAQAMAASKDGKAPLVVLHRQGDRYDDALCVLRLADFLRLADDGDD